MKKSSVLSFVAVAAILLLSSCNNNYKEKKVELKNQQDSLNYAFGFANGWDIKSYYFNAVENEEAAIKVFMEALKKSYESEKETETDQLYQLGIQIGEWFKQQKKDGLFEKGSNLELDYKLIEAGLLNGIKTEENGEEGMSVLEAEEIINDEVKNIAERKESEIERIEENATEEEIEVVEIDG